MSLLTVTAKGQVTLRRELLAHLGVLPGQRLVIEKLPNGRVELRRSAAEGRIEDVFDLLKGRTDVHLSIDEINQATSAAWAGER